MHASTLLTIALSAATTLADFQIYAVSDTYAIDNQATTTNSGFEFYNGEPDCDDVNHANFEASTDDASSYGVRMSVKDSKVSFQDQEVTLLEFHTTMGHFTIYEDSGYQLTPADGSSLRGSCVRDSGDDFTCGFGAADGFSGTRMFLCTSDLTVPTPASLGGPEEPIG